MNKFSREFRRQKRRKQVADALYERCKDGWPMGDVRTECEELARIAVKAISVPDEQVGDDSGA
jgi:hypothetical protein